MSTKQFLLGVALFSSVVGTAYAVPPVAGQFGLPYKANQTGPEVTDNCGWRRDQYHMEWNDDFGKYHMGEDWNGKCGDDTDEGAPLLAIADGEVVYVDTPG